MGGMWGRTGSRSDAISPYVLRDLALSPVEFDDGAFYEAAVSPPCRRLRRTTVAIAGRATAPSTT